MKEIEIIGKNKISFLTHIMSMIDPMAIGIEIQRLIVSDI